MFRLPTAPAFSVEKLHYGEGAPGFGCCAPCQEQFASIEPTQLRRQPMSADTSASRRARVSLMIKFYYRFSMKGSIHVNVGRRPLIAPFPRAQLLSPQI